MKPDINHIDIDLADMIYDWALEDLDNRRLVLDSICKFIEKKINWKYNNDLINHAIEEANKENTDTKAEGLC